MVGKKRRVPRFSAAQKLRGGNKSFKFFVLVFLLFSPCFLLAYLFCFVQMKCCFFCLLLFAAILAVFVCMHWSFFCSNQTVLLALSTHRYNCLLLTFFPCVFLVFYCFFWRLLTCLLVLLFFACFFLLCCLGRAVGFFSRLLWFFRLPKFSDTFIR